MDSARADARRAAAAPSLTFSTAEYLRPGNPGRHIVAVNGAELDLPSVGFYLFRPHDTVRVLQFGGSAWVEGPAVPKSPTATVVAVSATAASVRTPDGVLHAGLPLTLPAPAVGDVVLVDWPSGGFILARVPTSGASAA